MIIEIIKLFILTYVLKDMALFLGEILSEYNGVENKLLKLIIMLFSYILTCSDKCFPFWFSLILSGDLFIAAVIAILMKIEGIIENKYIQKTRL